MLLFFFSLCFFIKSTFNNFYKVGLSSSHILSSRLCGGHHISHPEMARLNPDLERMPGNPDLGTISRSSDDPNPIDTRRLNISSHPDMIRLNPDLERMPVNPDLDTVPGSNDDPTPIDARRLNVDIEREGFSQFF